MLIYQFQKSIKQNNKINKNTSKSWQYIQLANDTFHFELYIQGKKQTQPYIYIYNRKSNKTIRAQNDFIIKCAIKYLLL